MNKEEIREYIVAIQKTLIGDINERLKVNREAVVLDENSTHDPEDFSHQDEASELQNFLVRKLEKAKADLKDIQDIDFSLKHKIEIGAIVETQIIRFVIGIPTLPFVLEGHTYMGISPFAPIFAAMIHKKAGNIFNYATQTYQIIAIY